MLLTTLKFSGFHHYLSPTGEKDKKAYGKQFKKVYELETARDSLEFSNIHQGFQVKFPDQSSAYLHPFQNNAHHRVGAYKLSKLLNFNLAPKVKAIKLSNGLLDGQKKTHPKSLFGTLCDWIPGQTYHDFIAANPDPSAIFNKQNAIELYLFSLISLDSDFHDRNIIVGPATQTGKPPKLYAIDSEKTGAKQKALLSGHTKFPQALKNQIEGEDIPAETLAKIRVFLSDLPRVKQKLIPYFSENQVESFVNMARILLLKEEVPRQGELKELFRKAYLRSKPETPKVQSPVRSFSSPTLSYSV